MLARSIAVIAFTLALAGCDKPSNGGGIAPNDFELTNKHDEFKGDITTGFKTFTNDEKTQAQVTLTCSKDDDESKSNVGIGPLDIMAVGLWSVFSGSKAKFGCPDGYKCTVVAKASFFHDDKPVSLPAVEPGNGVTRIRLVYYDGKNDANGSIYRGATVLRMDGSTTYSNSVSFDVPTAGEPLSRWVFRFRVKGHQEPVDIALDYSAPNFSQFIKSCNDQAGVGTNSKDVSSSSSATPQPSSTPSLGSEEQGLSEDVRLAFEAVFHGSTTETVGSSTFQFIPKQLVPVDQNTFALISEGTSDECRGCHGALRVTYVVRDDSSYKLLLPLVQVDVPGGSWGIPPGWKVTPNRDAQTNYVTLTATSSYVGRGDNAVNECDRRYYRLYAGEIVEDKAQESQDATCK